MALVDTEEGMPVAVAANTHSKSYSVFREVLQQIDLDISRQVILSPVVGA